MNLVLPYGPYFSPPLRTLSHKRFGVGVHSEHGRQYFSMPACCGTIFLATVFGYIVVVAVVPPKTEYRYLDAMRACQRPPFPTLSPFVSFCVHHLLLDVNIKKQP